MISVIGGTGSFGRGLAGRLALAGRNVIIGSRETQKAENTASSLTEKIGVKIKGSINLEAAQKSQMVFLCIPYTAIDKIIKDVLPGLEDGDIVVSTVVPIKKEGERFVFKDLDGRSAAETMANKLPDKVNIVSGFQVVPAKNLQNFDEPIISDIPVCSDSKNAKRRILQLIREDLGGKPIDAGALPNSSLIESTAAFLVELTRLHKSATSVQFKGI